MRRMLFSRIFAVLVLTVGCQSSPPSAPSPNAGGGNPGFFARIFGSKPSNKPNPAVGPNGMPLGEKTKQDEAIESILKRGGTIWAEYEGMQKFVTVADLHGFHNAAAALERLAPLLKLRDLNLHDTAFNDADLVLLRGLPNLRSLNLSATKITDAGLATLQTLPNLSVLNLNETHVTNAGLHYLRGMENLSELDLYGTKVNDEGLAHLRGMALHKLVLGGSNSITDRGLLTLGEMPQLRDLILLSSRVTDVGIEDLKLASSQLRIVH